MSIKLGKYIHFKGKEYEVIGMATHSETQEELVVYRALYDECALWARPAVMWNEEVDYNGHRIKRFTHIDDIVKEEPPIGVHNYSKPAEKLALFLSLFAGRDDVFAKRWENAKKGTAGYVPVCHNEWTPLCPKSNGGKMRCSECHNQNFVRYSENSIELHLTGKLTAGAYPMFLDETCRFLVFDFDGKSCTPEVLYRDVVAIRKVCTEKNINMAVERSRSGKGFHFGIFFSENIPTVTARKFGSSLITYAMTKHHELPFQTYDRMLPNQDTLPKGGFGNLIALPLQKLPREQENSVFIDENFSAYADQWNYLFHIKRYCLTELESFTRQLSPSGELGSLHRDADEEKPWEKKKSEPVLLKDDFPNTVNIVQANMLFIEKSEIKSRALNTLKRLAAFRNPEFYKAQAMRLSTFNKPRIISCSDETEQYLCLPRGLEDEVSDLLENSSSRVKWIDKTNAGRKIDVAFNGNLRCEQQQAAEAILAHNNGILSATTAFGHSDSVCLGSNPSRATTTNAVEFIRRHLFSPLFMRIYEWQVL